MCGSGLIYCAAVTLLSAFALAAVLAGTAAAGGAGDKDSGGSGAAAKEIDAPGAASLIGQRKGDAGFTVIDVRTANEYSGGRIGDAVNIDYNSPGFREALSGLDKEAAYVVYCRSGRRSSHAVRLMEEMGFTDVYHVEGGILAWQDAGLPLVK